MLEMRLYTLSQSAAGAISPNFNSTISCDSCLKAQTSTGWACERWSAPIPQPLESCFPPWQKRHWDSRRCGLHPCIAQTMMGSKALATPGHSTAAHLARDEPSWAQMAGQVAHPSQVPALWPHQAVDKPTAAYSAPSLLFRGNRVPLPFSTDLLFKSI